MKNLFILSCENEENGGGIYKYKFNNNKLFLIKYFPCNKPMYSIIDGNKLHVLIRELQDNNSGYFNIDLKLNKPSKIVNTLGACACHLAVYKKDYYIVNYLSGNIVKNCEKKIYHLGKGTNVKRQNMAHTHCVNFSLDKKYILCTDLGLDTLFCYDRELNQISNAKVPNGYGIRHFVFSKNGKFIYAINELIPSISVFEFSEGALKYLSSCVLGVNDSVSTGAAIRISDNGKFLYCSVRGENTIYVLHIENENIELLQKISCEGNSPRDIFVTEKYLIASNELSNNATIFNLKNGIVEKLIFNIPCKKALCALCL